MYVFMYVDVGPFNWEAMRAYLWKNTIVLGRLQCNEIKLDLLAYELVTQNVKHTMDQCFTNPVGAALHAIFRCPVGQQPNGFKTLLQVMERSGIPCLMETAEELGRYIYSIVINLLHLGTYMCMYVYRINQRHIHAYIYIYIYIYIIYIYIYIYPYKNNCELHTCTCMQFACKHLHACAQQHLAQMHACNEHKLHANSCMCANAHILHTSHM